MEMPLDPESRNFAKVLGTKQAIASSILTATARTRQDQLQRTGVDEVAQLLEQLKAETDS